MLLAGDGGKFLLPPSFNRRQFKPSWLFGWAERERLRGRQPFISDRQGIAVAAADATPDIQAVCPHGCHRIVAEKIESVRRFKKLASAAMGKQRRLG